MSNISLSEKITENENLARVICCGSKHKTQKNCYVYDAEENKYKINTSVFIDTRNPAELSVNRISTLTVNEAHQLGLEHQKENNRPTYNGYAKLTAATCYSNNCKIVKDDYEGKKPYHANIIYPHSPNEKEEIQSIAIRLAFNAEFIKYEQ